MSEEPPEMTEAQRGVSRYRPLFVLFAVMVLASFALEGGRPSFEWRSFFGHFMGFFFIMFATFKFFELGAFATAFRKYDLVAARYRGYAYLYPFLELALGMLYLGDFFPLITNAATLALMSVSAVGTIRGVFSKEKLQCACLGTALNVPLSTVSIIENVGMGLMAAAMLAF